MKWLFTFVVLLSCSSAFAEGDIAKGEETFAICAVCHGENAQGSEDFDAPRLQGQHDWYLLTQLANFKAGVRGAHDDDDGGSVMIGIVESLEESDFADVVAYIATLEEVAEEEE